MCNVHGKVRQCSTSVCRAETLSDRMYACSTCIRIVLYSEKDEETYATHLLWQVCFINFPLELVALVCQWSSYVDPAFGH